MERSFKEFNKYMATEHSVYNDFSLYQKVFLYKTLKRGKSNEEFNKMLLFLKEMFNK